MSSSFMPTTVTLYKKRGETPLEIVERYRNEHPELTGIPLSYAGRLDPMAEGKLLVLIGEECKRQEEYTDLDKEYEIEVVLDISTDTGDVLGFPTYASIESSVPKDLPSILKKLEGSALVPYPVFSSKTVAGMPLFMYALAGTLNSIEIPEHRETVYRITPLNRYQLTLEELKAKVQDYLHIVPRSEDASKELGADFRQDAIREAWDSIKLPKRDFVVIGLRVICASGTYMRTLAERLGEELGTKGFALSINRTRIGTYKKAGPLGYWSKEY